jgi:hypothetical protein
MHGSWWISVVEIQNGRKGWRVFRWLCRSKRGAQAEIKSLPMTETMPIRIIMQRDLQTSPENHDPLPEPLLFRDSESKPKVILPPSDPPKPAIGTPVEGDEPEPCEDPKPLQTFQAVDSQTAKFKAHARDLLVLYKGIDKYTLYGRRRVYFALPPETALKLLKLTVDMMAIDEFNGEEQLIVKDLLGKRWVRKMKSGDRTYVYGLDRETAGVLQRQLVTLAKSSSDEK